MKIEWLWHHVSEGSDRLSKRDPHRRDPLFTGGRIHKIFKSIYLRAPEEFCAQPTMWDTTGEVYKPLGSLLRHSRGSGAEIDGG